jgi:hypothetical protein
VRSTQAVHRRADEVNKHCDQPTRRAKEQVMQSMRDDLKDMAAEYRERTETQDRKDGEDE